MVLSGTRDVLNPDAHLLRNAVEFRFNVQPSTGWKPSTLGL